VTPFLRAVVLVPLLGAHAHAADRDAPTPPRASDADERFSVSISNRAGLVEAPFVTTTFPEVSGFGMVLTGTASVRVSSIGWLRLRLPISVVRLDFPAGAQVSETALGNLELGLEREFEAQASTRFGLQAAILAPSAEHGPKTALLGNRALALTSALNGGKDSALVTPGVTGLRLAASIEHSQRPFEFRASLDVPLLVRLSEASLPEQTETHSLAILPAFELGTAWWITSGFGASLRATLIAEALRVQEPTLDEDRKRRVQVVLEPGLHVALGEHLTLGLAAGVPVGGNLGGDAWSIVVQGRVGF
jgi:hypothetical protein